MNFSGTYSLDDLGKNDIPYDELYARYQDALEIIMHFECRIHDLEAALDGFQEAYEEVSNKSYG